jgi:hypothetical protein
VEAFCPTKDGDINKRIGEVRKALGIRQDEFFEAIKASRSYIGVLETSHREINDLIIELCLRELRGQRKVATGGNGKMFKEKHNPPAGQGYA